MHWTCAAAMGLPAFMQLTCSFKHVLLVLWDVYTLLMVNAFSWDPYWCDGCTEMLKALIASFCFFCKADALPELLYLGALTMIDF